jgi:hypothetical protein
MGCCKSNSIRNEFVDISLKNSQSSKSVNKFFKEIIVFSDFEVENGVLGLDRDVYLSIVKFLDSSIVRKVCLNIFVLFNLHFSCDSTLELVKNHLNE